jgi:dihydropteroate synthase
MANAAAFLDLGVPILVGHSRKGFIGKTVERAVGRPATEADRDGGTAGAACALAAAGIQIVRVHAVGLVRSALELFCGSDR